jgi:phosphoribosyl 1,2-cyclic phosphodiesterase
MICFKSLASGSSGNATVVQAREGAQLTHLLIDCGLGIRQLEKRLTEAGLATAQIDAVFITHEHADHIGSACQFALRQNVPIFMSHGTYAAIGQPELGGLLRLVSDGMKLAIGAIEVLPFTVPHDAREPLQLTCSDGASRLGVLTDLGHASAHVLEQLAGCATVLLECNHDRGMLAASGYPAFLKRRVGGDWGHLANDSAAEIARSLRACGLKQVVAAHLSEQNNRPELARQALAAAMDCEPRDIAVADGPSGSDWLEV